MYEVDEKHRTKKRCDRRQGIYIKLKELNIVTGDHAYMELYKSQSEEGYSEVPDITTKKVVTTCQHLKGLGESIQGTPKRINLFEPTVTPEAAMSFSTPSKGKRPRQQGQKFVTCVESRIFLG